jgi:hypothetical protein
MLVNAPLGVAGPKSVNKRFQVWGVRLGARLEKYI